MSRGDTCSTCHHLTIEGYEQQAATGMGRCKGFDGHVAPVEPFVMWDQRFCVLYGRAAMSGKREAWIREQKDKQGNTNTTD
jgi:hypothetical protein